MSRRLVVAMGRHAATESVGIAASPGTQFLFRSLEERLERHFDLVRVPPGYYKTQARDSLAVAVDVVRAVDACIFGLPPSPFDLDPFFLVRDRLASRMPFLYFPLGDFPRGAWFHRNIHRYLRPQDLVVFSSNADRAIHDMLVSSTPARVRVIPFGIRPTMFRTSPATRATARRRYGVGRDEVIFVYHGRVNAEKNIHGAIMTFRRIARDRPQARLWIVGSVLGNGPCADGPHLVDRLPHSALTRAFAALIRDDGLKERVLFWGGLTHDKLRGVLAASDIGINFTLNGDENFGYSTVEAMAAGLPVLGTDWGGQKDTIEHAVTGFRVPTIITPAGIAIDHAEARRCALELVDNVARRKAMGAAGAGRAARLFTLQRFADTIAAEVRAQVAAGVGRTDARHAWSTVGTRLCQQYGAASNGARPLARPVHLTTRVFEGRHVMRMILQPYATRTQRGRPVTDAGFQLATELVAVRGGRLHSTDPRYVFDALRISAQDRAIIRVLGTEGRCSRATLDRTLDGRFHRAAVTDSLQRLIRTGIVIWSPPVTRLLWPNRKPGALGQRGCAERADELHDDRGRHVMHALCHACDELAERRPCDNASEARTEKQNQPPRRRSRSPHRADSDAVER